jgi:hypothetical protein
VRKLVLVIAAFRIAFLPVSAHADEQMILAKQDTPAPPSYEGPDSRKMLAIGAGVIIGAVAGYSVLTFRGAAILGAVAGGMIGGWWYGPDELATIEPLPRRNMP